MGAALCCLRHPQSKSADLSCLGSPGVLLALQTLVAMLGPPLLPPPRSAPLYPPLINLSAQSFDTLHNMVPVLPCSCPSLSIWFQHFKISQLTPPPESGVRLTARCFQARAATRQQTRILERRWKRCTDVKWKLLLDYWMSPVGGGVLTRVEGLWTLVVVFYSGGLYK